MVTWIVFIAWIAAIFLYQEVYVHEWYVTWTETFNGTLFGKTGIACLIFSGPILVIAFLSIAQLVISGKEEEIHEKKTPSYSLWTFPVIVDGPFGVVSAAEFIGIHLFVVYVIWALYSCTIRNLDLIGGIEKTPKEKRLFVVELTGLSLGTIGLVCIAFLFLPVARGSVLLRLINIPFGHATRYHVWLGNLTITIFTLHGLLYVIAWTLEGRLLHKLLEWQDHSVANAAGVVILITGLLMWATSLPPLRKQYFELFFYSHQLYVVFVIFLALHVGDFYFSTAAGGIFLFILDRFLRFCQSRTTVDIISATYLPCGAVELVVSKGPFVSRKTSSRKMFSSFSGVW